jgi:hypothetical protein
MRWSDPAWAAVGVALLALGVAIWSATLAWKSLTWERASAQSARRSAEAAERANLLTERVLAGTGSNAAARAATTAPSDVSWRIEPAGGNRFVLRNTGTGIAEHVGVDGEQLAGVISSNLPTDAVVRPGEGVDVLLMGTWQGGGLPNQLYVRWAGSDGYQAVPLVG